VTAACGAGGCGTGGAAGGAAVLFGLGFGSAGPCDEPPSNTIETVEGGGSISS